MNKHALTIGLVAALAACDSENHTIVSGGPADDTNTAANATVVLPPSILTSKVYRCADNVIVHVDWLSDGKSATLRTDQAGAPNMVSAAEEGAPMTSATGYSLRGDAQAGSVKIAVPGHNAQTCKA
jgi:hypothetical protein